MSTLKVLVPTDFSNNSKAGIRFALQWSAQQKLELVFIHIFHSVEVPMRKNVDYKKFLEQEGLNYKGKLERFIRNVYQSLHIIPGKYSLVTQYGISADISILDYCRKSRDIDYICIGTRGAGKFRKLFGTNTGNLITWSEVPVIAVPQRYRRRALTRLLYTTDLTNYSRELKKVISIAEPFKAKIEILHLCWPEEQLQEDNCLKALPREYRYGITMKMARANPTDSLFGNMRNWVTKSKPSLVIVFTDQHRNMLQKILFPSKAEQLSFSTTLPLLTIPKQVYVRPVLSQIS